MGALGMGVGAIFRAMNVSAPVTASRTLQRTVPRWWVPPRQRKEKVMRSTLAIGVGAFVAAGIALVAPAPAHADTRCNGYVVAVGPTSCEFAVNVGAAWRNSFIYPDGGLLQNVYSPVTGESYNMDCSKTGSGVVCTGGNGAEVIIDR